MDEPRLVNCVKMNEAKLNPEVVGIMDAALAKMTAAEALKLFKDNNIPCELCQTPLDVYEDENALVNGYLTKVNYPAGGRWVATPPCQFESEPLDPNYQPTGMAGSATVEVMKDLGYTDEQIQAARLLATSRARRAWTCCRPAGNAQHKQDLLTSFPSPWHAIAGGTPVCRGLFL